MEIHKNIAQYIETALWASSDDNDVGLDANYSIEDLAPETLARADEDCTKFLDLARLITKGDYDETDLMHDFWLTRNHHGAGFWDGDYPKEIGDALTALAHTFKEINLYVGDDGKLYFG